ncbi:alpha/beta fold hydrolase [Microbacterium sp. G2-8]|uniref:alpha/beta fold hydrolase n=1 Tax=Microbacterium sp. G2-8 TaxID=2842454 RepID=UPI001C898362|nr:alpha/beta hydrolase [Microbacterium sp. G2-8]
MDVILIAGFWLDGSSWRGQVPALEDAGHRVHTPTLPGYAPGDSTDVGLADHVRAIVELIDDIDGSVVLVGHSGGGAVAWGATDARPDRVARVIGVDAFPPPAGFAINEDLPEVDGLVPFPADRATYFDDAEFQDFTDDQLGDFIAHAIPVPARVAKDPLALSDEARWHVPFTIIATAFPVAMMEKLIEEGHPMTAELIELDELAVIELPTSHWPQLTRPDDLAQILVDEVARVDE